MIHLATSSDPLRAGEVIRTLCQKDIPDAVIEFIWEGSDIRDKTLGDLLSLDSLRYCKKCFKSEHRWTPELAYMAGIRQGDRE